MSTPSHGSGLWYQAPASHRPNINTSVKGEGPVTGGQRPGRQVEFARDNRVVGAACSDRAVPPVKALRSVTRPCSVSNRHSACGAVAANTASAERPHLSSPVGGPPCRRSPNGRPHARRSRLPEPCVSARMNATPSECSFNGPRRPRRSSSNPRRPGPRARAHPRPSSGSQLARRQSVGSWDHLRGNPTALRRAV